MGKLFTTILNNRVTEFVEVNNILSENQAGFRCFHSTVDHAFALKSLVDIFRMSKKRLYWVFVDFQKVLDSVLRHG